MKNKTRQETTRRGVRPDKVVNSTMSHNIIDNITQNAIEHNRTEQNRRYFQIRW